MEQIKKYKINYTQVSNTILNDSRLSLRAKGLYAYLFSKPDEWIFHMNIIEKELKESKGQLYSAIKELISLGYIIRRQINERGKFGGIIYEFIETPCRNNAHTGEPYTDFSAYGSTPTHNNTDIESNKYNNKYIYNKPPYIPPKENKYVFNKKEKEKENKIKNSSEDNKVGIDEGFNFGDCIEARHIANKYKLKTLDAVHKFLLQNFIGQLVDVAFIEKIADQIDSKMIKQES